MLYQIVTGEIREGDLFYDDIHFAKAELKPCKKTVGFDANDLSFPIFRPVKVPSEEEFTVEMNRLCETNEDDESGMCTLENTCPECYYKTMLRLMGLEEKEG